MVLNYLNVDNRENCETIFSLTIIVTPKSDIVASLSSMHCNLREHMQIDRT